VLAEASMAGLLQYFGLPMEIAVASTLIIRFGTLWFGVFLGWLAYVGFRFKVK